MRLLDLDASFLTGVSSDGKEFFHSDNIENAQGIMFQCPKCAERATPGKPEEGCRNYFIGVHYIICWFSNPLNAPQVPIDVKPSGRWHAEGTSLSDLTFTGPDAFSIQVHGGCNWHGYIKNGDAS